MKRELLGGILMESCIEDLDEWELRNAINEKQRIDEWGVFEMRKGHQGIELNFAFEYDEAKEEYLCQCAFYKVNYENEIGETDTGVYIHCEIDLNDIYDDEFEEYVIDKGFDAFKEIWG